MKAFAFAAIVGLFVMTLVFALVIPHVPALAKSCEVKSLVSIHCHWTW
jgi:hypothetical protein